MTSPIYGLGSWAFAGATNGSSRFLEFVKSKGDSVLELLSTPTKISGVHYVQVDHAPLFYITFDKIKSLSHMNRLLSVGYTYLPFVILFPHERN
jgi:hypothetical protein